MYISTLYSPALTMTLTPTALIDPIKATSFGAKIQNAVQIRKARVMAQPATRLWPAPLLPLVENGAVSRASFSAWRCRRPRGKAQDDVEPANDNKSWSIHPWLRARDSSKCAAEHAPRELEGEKICFSDPMSLILTHSSTPFWIPLRRYRIPG